MRADTVAGLPIAHGREDGSGRGGRPRRGASPRNTGCRRLRRRSRRRLAALRRAIGKGGQ